MVLWFYFVLGLMGCPNGPMDVSATSHLYAQTAIYGCIFYFHRADPRFRNQGMPESSQPFSFLLSTFHPLLQYLI